MRKYSLHVVFPGNMVVPVIKDAEKHRYNKGPDTFELLDDRGDVTYIVPLELLVDVVIEEIPHTH